MDSLKELEQIFSSKNNYRQHILEQSSLLFYDHEDSLNVALKSQGNIDLSEETIKKIKILHTGTLLDKRVKQLTNNIFDIVAEKVNVVAESSLINDFIKRKIDRLNKIYLKALIESYNFPQINNHLLSEFQVFVQSLIKEICEKFDIEDCLLFEDLINKLADLSEDFISVFNNLENKSNLKDFIGKITEEEILSIQFKGSIIHIVNLNSLILNEYKPILEIEYEIIQKGGLIELYKKPKNSTTQKIKTSYKSNLNDNQLDKLCAELKSENNKFIHLETSEKQFRDIFKERNIETITPVKWIKPTSKNKKVLSKISLIDFISILEEKNYIEPKYIRNNQKKELFQFIESYFKDGVKNENLKYTHSNFNSHSEYHDKLTNIISSI